MNTAPIARISLCLWLVAASVTRVGADEVATRQTLVHDGVTRSFVVRTPVSLDSARRYPLVIVLHGGGGNADNAERMTGFTAKAHREGFIVVYPDGSGPLDGRLLTWNAGHCCAYAMKHSVDDVGFISALIDDLMLRYPVDARRVYVTGMSNGGMMSHRLGIELSGKIAAIAPVVGTLFGDEALPKHAVPALMINGALDENVPPAGGPPGGPGAGRAWDGTPTKPATAQLDYWLKANGCDGKTIKKDDAHWTHWRAACSRDGSVELYLVKDNGHAWPGGQPGSRRGDTPSTSMNATDVIWDFFAAHAK